MADKKISALTSATTPLVGSEVLPIVQSGSTVKVTIADVTAGRSVTTKTIATYTTSSPDNATFESSTNTAIYTRLKRPNKSYIVALDINNNGGKDYTVFDETAGAARFSISDGGDVTVSTGNLVIGTANKGIDFSANTHAAGMTSELLNDYEEGTFTPTLSSSGTPPTVSGYASRYGSYTKIGNRVYISVNIRATVTAVGTGTPQITGFPYAANGNTLNGISLGLTDLMIVPFNANFISGSTLNLALGAYTVVTNGYLTFSAMYEI
jgi:hypothetical protein